MKKKFQYIALFGILGFCSTQTLQAQLKEEVLILNHKREPEVRKIEKKKTSIPAEKNYPPEEKKRDSITYSITNIPVVSDFETSMIQGTDISPKFDTDYHRNYFQLGYGNYGKLLVDGNVSGNIQDNMEVGVDVHHLSTNGLKKEYNWDSKQQNTIADIYLNSYGEIGKLNVDAGFELNNYNYYGNYQDLILPDSAADLKQNYTKFGVNGYYDFYSNEYLNDVRLKTSFTKDHFGTSENFYDILLNLSKHDLEINTANNLDLNIDLGAGIQSVNTDFDILNHNKSTHFAANFTPELTFFMNDNYLKIGSKFSLLNSQYENDLNPKTKQNIAYWFPTAEVLIALKDEVKFYAGVDGGIQFNTYNDLLHENPYLVSDLELRPTETKYHIYFGIKGDIDQEFKYDLSGGFSKINNILMFQSNDLFNENPVTQRAPYDYLNSFGVVYDNGNLSEVKIKAAYFPLENLNFSGELKYMGYSLKNLEKAYYKPVLQLTLGADYSMLNKKLNFGFRGIVVGDRKANAFSPAQPILGSNYITSEETQRSISGYVDLNLSASYKVHKNVSVFVMGNNLTNKSYENYLGYKVLGAQFLGGVRLEF